MRAFKFLLVSLVVFFPVSLSVLAQRGDLLTSEERLWLESRNSAIIAYPEKNNPPISYTSPGGNIQGLAIDYLELVAEKIDAKILYLSPQSSNQILNDFRSGKGDVIVDLMETSNRTGDLIFTDFYVNVPTVIIARKDYNLGSALTLNDFNGKKVAAVASSALEDYVRENYPRVVLETMTDDEVSLQQVILGEVDAAVMDIASLSFYLSKQVLSSVKIVGNVGLDFKPAFALRRNQTILQNILDKGMAQISTADREALSDKWVALPAEVSSQNNSLGFLTGGANIITLYVLSLAVLFVMIVLLVQHRHREGEFHSHLEKGSAVDHLKGELSELEKTNALLEKELHFVKEQEDKLQAQISSLDNK